MTFEDAATQASESNCPGRDFIVVVPGPGLLVDGGDSSQTPAIPPIIQCARGLLIAATGTVTFDTLAGPGRTFTVLSGMNLPVKLDVFVKRVTASTTGAGTVYAII